eukprot:scaffold147716_cov19-Tisochrysis_lutea.AAC.1
MVTSVNEVEAKLDATKLAEGVNGNGVDKAAEQREKEGGSDDSDEGEGAPDTETSEAKKKRNKKSMPQLRCEFLYSLYLCAFFEGNHAHDDAPCCLHSGIPFPLLGTTERDAKKKKAAAGGEGAAGKRVCA